MTTSGGIGLYETLQSPGRKPGLCAMVSELGVEGTPLSATTLPPAVEPERSGRHHLNPTMNTARRVAHAILFSIILLALASYRAGRWVGANRKQILDAIARAVLATYAAGQAVGRWWHANRQHITELADDAAKIAADLVDNVRWEVYLHDQMTVTLLPVQPVSK